MSFSAKNKDKLFIDDYWSRYQKHFFESRDDESILKLRDSIKEKNLIGVNSYLLEIEQVHLYLVMLPQILLNKQKLKRSHLMTII